MMYCNVMKGLPFFEERRYHIIELLEFHFRKGKPRTGFTSDLFIFLLSIRCLIKTFFERTPGTLLTAITDIGRFGELRANIFFVRDAGGSTPAASPARFVIRVGAVLAKLLQGTLMQESNTAVVERSA